MGPAAILSGHYSGGNGTQTLQICQSCRTCSPALSHLDFGELGMDKNAETVVPAGAFEFAPHRAVCGYSLATFRPNLRSETRLTAQFPLRLRRRCSLTLRPVSNAVGSQRPNGCAQYRCISLG